jgi:hypothetical protein
VVSNLANFNPDLLAKRVAEIYLADQMTPVENRQIAPESAAFSVDPKDLAKFAGVYPLPKVDQDVKIVVQEDRLWVAGNGKERMELRPVGPAHFYLKPLSADIAFIPKGNDGMSITVTQGAEVNEGDRLAPADAAVVMDLSAYAGTYWSEELETQYTFGVRDGKLFAMHNHHGEFELTPTHRDHFSSGQWYASKAHFIRDGKGEVTSVVLGGGRLTGVTFVRKPDGNR